MVKTKIETLPGPPDACPLRADGPGAGDWTPPDPGALARAALPARADPRLVVVLPLGATEQHGPHLSPDTDWVIADTMAARAAALASVPCAVLPAERVGYSPEHAAWRETRTAPFDALARRWMAIGEAVAARGARRLLLLNAHGGNAPLLTIVATELRARRSLSWSRS